MEVVTRAVYPNSICEGCLTRDRILAIITNDEIKKVYCTIIHEKLDAPGPLVLCWECIAHIQRYITFRRQCSQAHDTLMKYMLQPTSITSLSKLTIAKNDVEIKIKHIENESLNGVNLSPKQNYLTKWTEESQNVFTQRTEFQNHRVQVNVEDQNGVFLDPDESVKCESDTYSNKKEIDIAFIKVEDDNMIDEDGYYGDGFDHQDCDDDKDLAYWADKKFALKKICGQRAESMRRTGGGTADNLPELSPLDNKFIAALGGPEYAAGDSQFRVNPLPSTVALKLDNEVEKSKAKSKKGKKKKSKEDFNESDDEPLTNKKRSKNATERKHKRKKHEEDVPKEKNVKPPRKREKPPGVVNNPRVNKKLQQLNVEQGQLEMVVLSWEEVEEERQKALNSVVFTRHEYRCADCIVGFNHKFKLDNHMKKHDPCAGEMVCSVCKVRCRDSHALCAHRRRHRVRWRCCLCGATASRAAVAADHVSRAHRAAAPTHTCSVCGHAEPTLGKLRNHIKNHAERQKCDLCGKTFRDRTSLRTHLFIHKGEKEYSCPRCDKKFLFKKAMEVHLVTHDAPAHLYCYQCDMNFKNRMSYNQHMKYSLKHIDPAKLKYACQLCDKKFVKATRLEEHNVAVHLKATPISCTVQHCTFACSSRPVLRTHIRMVHRNARAQRNHVCDACGKTYTTKKTLEGHMRSHTGERPFKCGLCPSTFGYEAALYNHNKLVHLKPKICRRTTQPSLPLQIPGPPDLT